MNIEKHRLIESQDDDLWKKWGPYDTERQWGTEREDYSPNGDAWQYLTHDESRSTAYRWGEDGIAGISDDKQQLCLSLALWNGRNPILKERLFGLSGDEGNQGTSRYHKKHPFTIVSDGVAFSVDYQAAESTSFMFGGNSNWRGPVWFPVNFLIIESPQKFHHYYGDDFEIEYPTGSGNFITIDDVAEKLSKRLSKIFLKDPDNVRPLYGSNDKFQNDDHFRDHVLFFEYFDGDNGAGLGASHQTGWTGLVAKLLMPRLKET
jgi:hypothetical protein